MPMTEPIAPAEMPPDRSDGAAATFEASYPVQVPIDLASALELTEGGNPSIDLARQRIREAYARRRSAEVLWLPSLRAGANYNKHDGVIQDVAGNMVSNSRSSVYTGLGGRAVGAASPSVPGLAADFHLRDAIFQPRIAGQVLGATRQASRAAVHDQLLETAVSYVDLLEAIQVLEIADETTRRAAQLHELALSFAETGQGLRADADLPHAELAARKIEGSRAAENVRVASVRLARTLGQQDQSLVLVPQEPAIVPLELVPSEIVLATLIADGLSNRPELAENRYLVGEAVERLRRDRYAPLVPSVLLGLSYGGNGGSPSSDITDFDDRVDFDAAVFWELRNLGLGERYAQQTSQAQVNQVRSRQIQLMDRIASEVAEAHAQVESRRTQIDLAEEAVAAAEDSYRRNSERVADGLGLPLETLQSIQALDQAQRQYARTIADFDRAQFRLLHALGWPE